MRTIFFFLLLLCGNPLFSQNKSSIKNMSDQQKFMEAYETLANLAKKNPLMPKLWTDAQMNLLRQAKEIYFALKNEAAGDNNQFKAQTVAFKKPNPNPNPDLIPDDDDPNTIKKKEFVPAVLDLLIKLQTNLSSIEQGSRPVLIAVVKEKLTAKMNNKTPIGKELNQKFNAAIDNAEPKTVDAIVKALRDIIVSYDNNTLTAHYNIKENKAAYQEKKDDKELWPVHLVGDIPTDTTFITDAADAYEKEQKFTPAINNFFVSLLTGLSAYQNENFLVEAKVVVANWKTSLKEAPSFIFADLFKDLDKLSENPTISEMYQVVADAHKNYYSDTKLEALAPQCKNYNFLNQLTPALGELLAKLAADNKYKISNQNKATIDSWSLNGETMVVGKVKTDSIILSVALKQSLKEQAKDWAKQPLPAEIVKRWEQSISADKNMSQRNLLKKLVDIIKDCQKDQAILGAQSIALANQALNANLENLLLLVEQADSIGVQQKFVKIWIDRQTEWINSIPGDANEFTGFSIKKLKELEPDFQNAKFWFEGFKTALSKITKDSISTSELSNLLKDQSVRKDAAALEKEFSNCLEEQKSNIKNFVDSLAVLLPAGNAFLLSANYKPTIIKINPTPAEIAEGVKSASDSLKLEFYFPVGEDILKPLFKVDIAVPIKLSERKYKAANNKMYPHFYVAGDAQGYISANNGMVGADVISVETTIGDEPKDILTPYYASISVAIIIKLPAIEVTQEDSSSSPSFGVTLLSAAAGGGAAAIALLSNPAGWVIGAAGILTCVAGLFAGYSSSKATGKTWVFPEETYTITMEGRLQSVLNSSNHQSAQILLQPLKFKITNVSAMNNADEIKKKLQIFSGDSTSRKQILFEEPI